MIHADYKQDSKQAHEAYLTLAGYAIANKEKDSFYYEQESKFDRLTEKHGWSMSQFSIRSGP